MAATRDLVNRLAGSRRMLCHAVFTPGQDGWLDEVDRAIEVLKPDAWKGYTVGNPFHPKNLPYRLDDEKLLYPFYEKVVASGHPPHLHPQGPAAARLPDLASRASGSTRGWTTSASAARRTGRTSSS